MSLDQDLVAELRGEASTLADHMKWLVRRIGENAPGFDVEAAMKTVHHFDTIIESMSKTSARWMELVDPAYAEFEVNRQQLITAQTTLAAAQAAVAKERVEIESSRHELDESTRQCNANIVELGIARQKFDDERNLFQESLDTLCASNMDILGKLTQPSPEQQRQNEAMGTLRESYGQAQVRLEMRETELASTKTRLQKVERDLEFAQDQHKRAMGLKVHRISHLEDQLYVAARGLGNQIQERVSLQEHLDEVQPLLVETINEREEARKLATEQDSELKRVRGDLEKTQTETAQLRRDLAKEETSLKRSEEKTRELEASMARLEQRKRGRDSGTQINVGPLLKRRCLDMGLLLDGKESRWYSEIEDLKSFFYNFRIICLEDSNISLGDALAEFVRSHYNDYEVSDPLADLITDGEENTWWCYRQMADSSFFGNRDALIEDDKCYIHKDRCFQVCNARKTEGYGAIYCRVKEYNDNV
ncbi:hypothetical protein GGS24DRAFT_227800 [Hypoxylon argillaceum]|nr:hypothetical protein GGS24DRAFT_227800 [Hypoxylon argillaceum]